MAADETEADKDRAERRRTKENCIIVVLNRIAEEIVKRNDRQRQKFVRVKAREY